MAGENKLPKTKSFPGVFNVHPEESLRFGSLREAENVDLIGDPELGIKVRMRQGRKLFVDDPGAHSVFAEKGMPFGLYGNLAGELKAVFPDKTTQVLKSGIGIRDISCARINDRIFWTNGQFSGIVTLALDTLAWGVENPGRTPTCAPAASGGLDAGKYLVCCTFMDRWGRESGTGVPQVVDVEASGGIELSDIPQPVDTDVVTVRLYVSAANGEVCYHHHDVPVGTLDFLVTLKRKGKPLQPVQQMLFPMPAGHITRFLNGQHLVMRGKQLLMSPGLWFGQCNPSRGYIGFPARGDLMEPVGDSMDGAGVYVAAGDTTYFLTGTNLNIPEQVSQRRVKSYGAIPGTCRRVDANLLGLEGMGSQPVPVWLSKSGQYYAGLPGGTIITLRQNDAVTDVGDKGATMFVESNGHRQLVTALKNARPSGLRITDRVTVTEYKHYEEAP